MEATLSAGTIPVPARDMLTQVLRQGAQQMLAQAIESLSEMKRLISK